MANLFEPSVDGTSSYSPHSVLLTSHLSRRPSDKETNQVIQRSHQGPPPIKINRHLHFTYPPQSVFLVGGYAASPWLFTYVPSLISLLADHPDTRLIFFLAFRQLQERLAPYGVSVSRPDTQTYALSPLPSPQSTNMNPNTARKQWRTERSAFTATTTSRHACPNSCTASSF